LSTNPTQAGRLPDYGKPGPVPGPPGLAPAFVRPGYDRFGNPYVDSRDAAANDPRHLAALATRQAIAAGELVKDTAAAVQQAVEDAGGLEAAIEAVVIGRALAGPPSGPMSEDVAIAAIDGDLRRCADRESRAYANLAARRAAYVIAAADSAKELARRRRYQARELIKLALDGDDPAAAVEVQSLLAAGG
jgi:hypothetical protein